MQPDGPFRTVLTTRGRRTGEAHSVELLAVMHGGDVYVSRHRPDSDWFRNALACPDVTVAVGGRQAAGAASEVTDAALQEKISHLKYPGQARAAEKRAAIRIRLCE